MIVPEFVLHLSDLCEPVRTPKMKCQQMTRHVSVSRHHRCHLLERVSAAENSCTYLTLFFENQQEKLPKSDGKVILKLHA